MARVRSVQVGEAVNSREGAVGRTTVDDAVPEGLEPFFYPELQANGHGPCQCSPEGVDEDGNRLGRGRAGVKAEAAPCGCPPPRLFTFAAPGRNGAGMFYGACLSVFRCVCVCANV